MRVAEPPVAQMIPKLSELVQLQVAECLPRTDHSDICKRKGLISQPHPQKSLFCTKGYHSGRDTWPLFYLLPRWWGRTAPHPREDQNSCFINPLEAQFPSNRLPESVLVLFGIPFWGDAPRFWTGTILWECSSLIIRSLTETPRRGQRWNSS